MSKISKEAKKEDAPVKADSVPHKSNPDRDVL